MVWPVVGLPVKLPISIWVQICLGVVHGAFCLLEN